MFRGQPKNGRRRRGRVLIASLFPISESVYDLSRKAPSLYLLFLPSVSVGRKQVKTFRLTRLSVFNERALSNGPLHDREEEKERERERGAERNDSSRPRLALLPNPLQPSNDVRSSLRPLANYNRNDTHAHACTYIKYIYIYTLE